MYYHTPAALKKQSVKRFEMSLLLHLSIVLRNTDSETLKEKNKLQMPINNSDHVLSVSRVLRENDMKRIEFK